MADVSGSILDGPDTNEYFCLIQPPQVMLGPEIEDSLYFTVKYFSTLTYHYRTIGGVFGSTMMLSSIPLSASIIATVSS